MDKGVTLDAIRHWVTTAARAASAKKAENTVVLDVGGVLSITDAFVITSGHNRRHVLTVLDAEGRVVYSSPAGQRMLGYPPGFWKGHNVFELVHPEDAARVTEVFLRHLAAPGLTEPVEFRMRHNDGGWRSVEAIGNNLLEDPAVAGMVVTTRDVTDRHEAEAALRTSEARFRSLVQRSYDVI